MTAFIASLPVIRAKETASLESGLASMTNVSLPITSCPSWTPCGRIVSSAKTSRGTLRSSSTHSAAHWSAWVTSLRREYSVRGAPAIRTGANASSSWPTARTVRGGYTRDKGDPTKERPTLEGLAESRKWPTPTVLLTGESTDPAVFAARQVALKERHRGRTGNGAGPDLAMIAKTWPDTWRTPMASDTGEKASPATHQLMLCNQARNWPTPAARDHKGVNSTEHVEVNGSGRMHLDQLPNFVAYCLPPCFPDHPTADGGASSTVGHNLPPPSTGRKLNPFFVEALMRWPSGLSGFARAETAWTRWWALMPGYVLALCSDSGDPAGPVQGQLL
nr:hypothetical protein [Sphingomonas paucimobilis]